MAFRLSCFPCVFTALIATHVAWAGDGDVASALPGAGADAGKTVVYRDTWGVPHIYAPSVEAGLYAMGYAQAEDRPEQLLANFAMAMGEYARVAGEGAFDSDVRARMFDHYEIAKRAIARYSTLDRRRIESFARGIDDFYRDHPNDRPTWWGDRPIDAAMVDAFGRFFLYNWSIDEAYGDLKRGGVDIGSAREPRASNQWAVSPSRTADGHAMLLIDPHLAWWGVSRFWELRIHAGELEGSGVGLAGSPWIGLGHNAHLAWAMTTGGPDTADVYALTVDGNRYRHDGDWRELTSKQVTLEVKDAPPRLVTIQYSHHGPIIARHRDKAYAARIAYGPEADRNRAWTELNFAKDYTGAVRAGATLSMFPQNMMVADTNGNIYYQRVGRVPIRAPEHDWTRPVDGSTSATEWRGFHPSSDHLQVLNPAQGYMQNCNVPPDAMMVDSPFQPETFPDYLFASAHYGPSRAGWSNLRGARALELLSGDESLTIDEALAHALDVKPYGIERWVDALATSAANADLGPAERAALAELGSWNGELARDSRPALKYAYWRHTLADEPPEVTAALRQAIDDAYAPARGAEPKAVTLTPEQSGVLLATFRRSLDRLTAELGRNDRVYGDVFRVGRDGVSWPVGGGGSDQLGLTTLRTVGYAEPNAAFERWGNRGQTSTQLVVLSRPIRSWIYLPVGQSDRPDSPHYRDQAERLFSPRRLKPSWWLPEDLAPHVESRTELNPPTEVSAHGVER